VQLVVTGDSPMDEHLDALVKAVREAAWNAVRHASPPVSAYVEVGPDAVEAFVRDHGSGFDLSDVPDDRAGVRESIIGRMERHGGSARIRRRPDGTEVELRLPVTEPAPAGSNGRDGNGKDTKEPKTNGKDAKSNGKANGTSKDSAPDTSPTDLATDDPVGTNGADPATTPTTPATPTAPTSTTPKQTEEQHT
jgi:hypothetical protein